MSDLETKVRNDMNEGVRDLILCRMSIIDKKMSIISEILMNCKTITSVDLSFNEITTLKNTIFPLYTISLYLGYNKIASLDGFVVPDSLRVLQLVFMLPLYQN